MHCPVDCSKQNFDLSRSSGARCVICRALVASQANGRLVSNGIIACCAACGYLHRALSMESAHHHALQYINECCAWPEDSTPNRATTPQRAPDDAKLEAIVNMISSRSSARCMHSACDALSADNQFRKCPGTWKQVDSSIAQH